MNNGIEKQLGRQYFIVSSNMVPFLFVLLIITIVSFLLSLKTLFINDGTELLFLLPISFAILFLLSGCKFLNAPLNLAALLIVGIEFVKLVLVPTLFVLSDFPRTIEFNAVSNDYYGIILQVYEAFWIGYALNKGCRYKESKLLVNGIEDKYSNKKFKDIMIFAFIFTALICYLAPEILLNYRTIFLASDSQFTNVEQSYIVDMYSSSTSKKLLLVIANYWLKPMRLVLPAFIMVLVARYVRNSVGKLIAFSIAFSPFLFVDGTVARSLYFTVVLFLIYNCLYNISSKDMIKLIFGTAGFIIIYWCVRYYAVPREVSLLAYFAEKLNDYFCGFNIVGGTLNLPGDIQYRVKYFVQDFTRTIPFANTIFKMDSIDTIRIFFNYHCHTTGGQIASTLGMGSYYLTPIFAPLYAFTFTRNAINYSGLANDIDNPYYKLVYYFIALYFALGIGLNDISVTLSNLVQVCLPIYIMIKLAYPSVKKRGK